MVRRVALTALAALLAGGCARGTAGVVVGSASGNFDCDVFRAGLVPPDYGDGAVAIDFGGESRDVAEGAAAFAVDANGEQTTDPTQAAYFAVQLYQDVAPSAVEVFEVRALPAVWRPGDIELDGINAVAIYARVALQGSNGVSTVIAVSTDGALHLDAAGEHVGDAVSGTIGADLESPQ